MKKKIQALLVEDDDDHAELITRHAARADRLDASVTRVRSLQDAITHLEHHTPDVVLLDQQLEDSRYEDTLVRLLPAAGAIPIVVLTSLDDMEYGRQAIQHGAQDYLIKSNLGPGLLSRAVLYAIERSRARIALEEYSERLESSNRELEQFANTIAHEIRTPLATASYAFELLRGCHHQEFDDQCIEWLDDATDAVQHVGRTLEGILAYARAGSIEEMERFELDAACDEALEVLESALEAADAEIHREPLPEVRGSRTAITQVFQNLIDNAIKYRRPDRPLRIEISATGRGNAWQVDLRDNGRGIPNDLQARVFELFRRATPEEEVHGSGIGLAFAARIVKRHDGRIWVSSRVDEGSTFSFTLPRPDED